MLRWVTAAAALALATPAKIFSESSGNSLKVLGLNYNKRPTTDPKQIEKFRNSVLPYMDTRSAQPPSAAAARGADDPARVLQPRRHQPWPSARGQASGSGQDSVHLWKTVNRPKHNNLAHQTRTDYASAKPISSRYFGPSDRAAWEPARPPAGARLQLQIRDIANITLYLDENMTNVTHIKTYLMPMS